MEKQARHYIREFAVLVRLYKMGGRLLVQN